MKMTKRARKYLILSAVVLLVLFLFNLNFFLHLPEYFRCRKLINQLKNNEGVSVKKIYYDKEQNTLFFDIIVSGNDELFVQNLDRARNTVENYLADNSDFYYIDNKICLHYKDGAGNSFTVSTSDYSGKLSRFSFYISSLSLSDLSSLYDVTDIYGQVINDGDYTFFDNNPDLRVCKISFRASEEELRIIQELCPNCEIDIS